MANPRITDYIKNAREKDGLSDKAIKNNLRFSDWKEKEIEESFRVVNGIKEEGPATEFPREDKPNVELQKEEGTAEEFSKREGFIEKPKKLQFNKKYLIPLIILVVFVSLTSASILIYNKFFKKIDPISLLPQETAFYLRVKINPEDKEVKNFKELLNKFPYYEKFSEKISEGFEKLKEEEPNLKNLDFTISDEIIFAFISPFEENMEQFPLIMILPHPDLEKLEKLAEDVQDEIEKSGAWKIEKETYKGRIVVKAVSTLQSYIAGPEIEPSTTLTNGHFILATKPEDIKKIIDVVEDQKIINIFKGGKEKNIYSNTAYKKIKKYLPKDYLALFYGGFDWSKFMKSPGVIGAVAESEDFLGPFTASLKAALDLPFFGKKESEESEKIAFVGAIIVEKNELKTEGYSLDLREDAFEPSPFSFEESLANFIPGKIGNKDIVFYGEGRNLKSSFKYLEETLTKQMTAEEKREYEEGLKSLRENLGVDLKKDILALFDKNYALILSSEATGKETPSLVFILEVGDENKAKENLLKISVPKIPTIEQSLEQSRLRAKDARVMSHMAQIRTMAEIIYTEKGGYQNVGCNYSDIKTLCNYIKEFAGSKPIIYQSRDKYCVYIKLNQPGYYCIDSTGKMGLFHNPGEKGYCTGITFLCPQERGIPLPLEEIEKVSFSKEIVNGFEIYSLPIYEEFGLNFSIKDKKIIFTLTKDGLTNVLKSLTDSNQRKLKDSDFFAEQFKEVPKNITEISYSYPYGYLGTFKWLTSFIIDFAQPMLGMVVGAPGPTLEMEKLQASIFEFLDKGIVPYLKVLKSAGSYSYSPEKGLTISKGRLIIEELPAGEKRAAEEFWENIEEWFLENFGPIFGPVYSPPITPIPVPSIY